MKPADTIRTVSLVMLLTTAAGAEAQYSPPLLPIGTRVPEQLEQICAGTDFLAISKLRALPKPVQLALGADNRGLGGIADRDEFFNSIDAIDFRLPSKRFRNALQNSQCIIVEIELGGIALRRQKLLFRPTDDGWVETPMN